MLISEVDTSLMRGRLGNMKKNWIQGHGFLYLDCVEEPKRLNDAVSFTTT